MSKFSVINNNDGNEMYELESKNELSACLEALEMFGWGLITDEDNHGEKMKYAVKWSIELEKTVDAESENEAEKIIENIDCQHDGSYIEDSFIITTIKKI